VDRVYAERVKEEERQALEARASAHA